MRLFVFCLAIAAASAQSINSPANPAQPANRAQPGDSPKKARLEGSVVSLTGEAIPRATVRLQGGTIQPGQPATGLTATADDAGKFVFADISPGTNYQLSVQRPGYIPARYGARSANAPGAPLSLDDGQVLKGLTITMTPQGVVTGKVTDRDNDPIQGAQVILLRSGYQRGVRPCWRAPPHRPTTREGIDREPGSGPILPGCRGPADGQHRGRRRKASGK